MRDSMFLRKVRICVTRLDDVTPQETVAFFHTAMGTSNLTGFVRINLSSHSAFDFPPLDEDEATTLSRTVG